MQVLEVAGNVKVLERLEVIRKLNAKREWINDRLYGLTTKEELLTVAYERLKSKPGNMTPGYDDQTLDGLSMRTIKEFSEQLKSEKYQPKPVRTTYIPKANGKKRKLGIPSPRDKVVQEVVRMILEAVYDSPHGAYFSESSHGFRPNRSCHTALKEVQGKWSGVMWFIEGDIPQCFDDINHETLIEILRKKIKDERFISLIKKFLRAGYLDIDRVLKNSLAGTPQGGIISPILSNIYLHELDEYVKQLQAEYEKGKERKHNPEYRTLQDRRLRLAREGKTGTKEYKALTKAMRELPSGDPQDKGFVRLKYVRYADDWIVGIIGPQALAEEIKEKIGQFLKSKLHLTLSQEKTRITNARSEEAEFLGYRIRLGRSDKEQKVTKSTNGSGRVFARRATGFQVVLKAPIDKVIKRLAQKGFCDNRGNPTCRKGWANLDEDQIIGLFSSVNRGLQQYYRPADNWGEMRRIQYILKYSLLKTLALKRKTSITKVIRNGRVFTVVKRKAGEKVISLYENSDWKTNRDAFTKSKDVDLVKMSAQLRTRSKLGFDCCICGEENGVEMHHVRHIRKMSERKVKGFMRIMAILNRKQIPVCEQCHRKIHSGKYDGLKLEDLAYDPSKLNGLDAQLSKNRNEIPEWLVNRLQG
jgi:group II intron reverse transcriptase/maturase